jgi:hypothetical protein
MHRTENSKPNIPEMKLRGFIPNVFMNDLYIPMIGPQTQYTKVGGSITLLQALTLISGTQTRCRRLDSYI